MMWDVWRIQTTNTGAGVRCELWSGSAGCCWHHYRHENVVQSTATIQYYSVPGTMSVTGWMMRLPAQRRRMFSSHLCHCCDHCVLQPLIECSLYTSWLLAYNCTWLVVNKPLTSSSIVWCVFMKISLTFVSTEECRYIICTFHNHKIQRADSNTNMYVY